jgi:hypothetical protein
MLFRAFDGGAQGVMFKPREEGVARKTQTKFRGGLDSSHTELGMVGSFSASANDPAQL